MKTLIKTTTLVALAVLAVSCGGGNKPGVSVTTASVRLEKLVKTVEFTGVLAPNQTANVMSRISAQVRELHADVGSQVRAGQTLVVLDGKELNAQLVVANAAIDSVKDQAGQAQITIETAKTNQEMAQKNFDRMKNLFASAAATQSQLDDAQTKLDLSKRAYETAQKQYQIASGSSLAQASAQENLIQVQISNTEIAAPISGTVTNRNILPGEIAAPGVLLMTIADISALKLQGNVTQDIVPFLKIGDSAQVQVDALLGEAETARIYQIGPVGASTGQYFPVIIQLKNNGKLLAGMTAKASFTITTPPVLLVPLSAVLADQGHQSVFVLDGDIATKKDVQIGLNNGKDAVIISGLKQGDLAVTSNVSLLQDGQTVVVAP